MEWADLITIVVAILGVGTFLGIFLNKMDNDIRDVRNDLGGWVKHIVALQAEQSKRTDNLHQMIYDLLKERK